MTRNFRVKLVRLRRSKIQDFSLTRNFRANLVRFRRSKIQDCSLTQNFRAKLVRFRRSKSISYLRVFRTRLHAYRVQLLFHQRIETPLNLGFASLSLVTDPEKFGGQPSRFIQLSWPVFSVLPTKFSGLNTGRDPILFGLTQSHPGS